MSSSQANTSGASDTGRDDTQYFDMVTPISPTDGRHPLARVESVDEQAHQNEGLSESYQSTDTIRRRPEPLSYGMQMSPITWQNIAIHLYSLVPTCTDVLYRCHSRTACYTPI
jgi:hypothetical protein